jgi:hypothetical protein
VNENCSDDIKTTPEVVGEVPAALSNLMQDAKQPVAGSSGLKGDGSSDLER